MANYIKSSIQTTAFRDCWLKVVQQGADIGIVPLDTPWLIKDIVKENTHNFFNILMPLQWMKKYVAIPDVPLSTTHADMVSVSLLPELIKIWRSMLVGDGLETDEACIEFCLDKQKTIDVQKKRLETLKEMGLVVDKLFPVCSHMCDYVECKRTSFINGRETKLKDALLCGDQNG